MMFPLIEEIQFVDPLTLFALFADKKGSLFFDSAHLMENCGQYSFIAIEPFEIIANKNDKDPFELLEKTLQQFPLKTIPNLPPFQGGIAGYFSYDLCHHVEKLPRTFDDMNFPDLIVGYYDLVIAFDHMVERAWIISSGYPELNETIRLKRAELRLEDLKQKLKTTSAPLKKEKTQNNIEIKSNFTAAQYQLAVEIVKNYILAGDIFEANISQRFHAELPKNFSTFDLYQRLRLINPAPFSAFLNFEEVVLASASPERFLKLMGKHVETRPIKGTCARGKTVNEDLDLKNQLLKSEKDRAENIMIVDLLRNDLSRVCEDHSVQISQLCGLETYATVHHLVSVVTGKLNKNISAIDLLRASFPGGSITGAPKVRAMEIIAEIEPHQRGPYCGSIGYMGFDGNMDVSITIRTFAIKDNIVTFQAGGAVVADSDPKREYEETLIKSFALRRALVGN